jgi:hypothetical protein
MRHTQVPWVAEKAKLDQGHIEIYSGSILVADVMSDDNSADGNGVLNARLIAAAPELYEDLRALRARTMALAQALRQKGHSNFVNDWLSDGILDCESIAKAEGR